MPTRFTPKSVALFLLKFTVAYAVAFWVHWTPPVFMAVHRVFVGTSGVALSVLQRDVTHRMHLHNDRTIHVTTVVADYQKDFDIEALYGTNLAMFVALVLASPGLTWRARGIGLAVGTAVIVGVNTWVMVGTIWNFEAQYPALQPHLPTGVVSLLGRLANQLSPTGGLYMLPVFLWGFVLLSPVLTGDRAGGSTGVGRNEPCPCGSGRKYKACCGV